MKYRAVKANDSDDVIAIGYDEGQGGKDYNGIGKWCDFTFDAIPDVPQTVKNYMEKPSVNLLKVSAGKVVAKTLVQVQTEIEP